MLKVFICEDNDLLRKKFTKIIKNFIIIENFDMEVALSTENPYSILDYITNNETSGLYFLDINLNADIDGLILAEKIREYDPRGFIVFITTNEEMTPLIFKYRIEAMDYIIKDDFHAVNERIYQCIINANKRYSAKATKLGQIFNVKINDKIINVEYNKILFFETSQNKHKIILHAIDKQFEFNSQVKEIEDKLDINTFYKCHKSYIININNIKEIDVTRRIAHMVNGEECLISFRALNGLKKLLMLTIQ